MSMSGYFEEVKLRSGLLEISAMRHFKTPSLEGFFIGGILFLIQKY
jgi:hypothetical protein